MTACEDVVADTPDVYNIGAVLTVLVDEPKSHPTLQLLLPLWPAAGEDVPYLPGKAFSILNCVNAVHVAHLTFSRSGESGASHATIFVTCSGRSSAAAVCWAYGLAN